MSPSLQLIAAGSSKYKQHSVSNFFSHTVSKYLCSFLWCAFSRVSTGTLSWLEGTLHALQRINIRTSMSRATRMLHAMATTAAVDSPVVEMESSRSHSCITDTETASLPQTSWSVTCEAQRFKALLVDVTITLLSLLVTQGFSWSWTSVSYFSHLLYSHIKDTLCSGVGGRLWNWSDDGSRAKPEDFFGLVDFVFFCYFHWFDFCFERCMAVECRMWVLNAVAVIHLRPSFLCDR